MNVPELIGQLSERDIRLWLQDDRLRYSAPKGILTPELRAMLTAQKGEIIAYLRNASIQPSPLVPVVRGERDLPLSFAQQRLWFFDQFTPQDASYNVPRALLLHGPLGVAVIEHCIEEIVARHESLRTTFHVKGNQPFQMIAAQAQVYLPVIDISSLSDGRECLQSLMLQEMMQPFDLVRGPLLRTTVIRLGPETHALLFTAHHIISDGWSMDIFVHELALVYNAFITGAASPLQPLPVQYADFAVWKNASFQGQLYDEQVAYWKQNLDGAQQLELPTDYPRPAVQTFAGTRKECLVSSTLSNDLKKLSLQHNVTLFMLLLTAFQVLLSRYSNQTDISVGVPVTNRDQHETEDMIGCFINTLVLRTQFFGDPSFREALTYVREICLGAYSHQDMPFEKLVEIMQPGRSLSHSPLFQVMFLMQPAHHLPTPMQDLTVEQLVCTTATAKFDLTLDITDTDQGLLCVLEYNTDLFSARTIERFLDHWQTLLAGIVASPEQRLSKLPVLTQQERQKMLIAWNSAHVLHSGEHCPHEAFEAQVARTPDALALVFEDEALTYLTLNQRANQLAHYLQKAGVEPGSRVGICLERSPALIIGLFGILKAGGTYVPLDPAYPSERLKLMLEAAGIEALITRERYTVNLAQEAVARCICIDDRASVLAEQETANPVSGVGPDHCIYVIFTSGSTGQPKGAGVYQRGFMNLLHWYISEFHISAQDRVLLITSLSFDLTQKNVFAPLIVGGTLHLIASPYHDIALLSRAIAERMITLLNCTPSMFYPFVNDADEERYAQLSSLRLLFLGGEPIAVQRLRRWTEQAHCHTEIVNTYGPTECSDVVSFYRLRKADLCSDTPVPIGYPVHNVQLLILDEAQQLVPLIAVGELSITGVCVGAGYLNDVKLNAERFVANPFAELTNKVLYRTGDLVRYREDGAIEYVGRKDHQVKIRGFRIELEEISSVLSLHPMVQDCVILVVEEQDDKRLVAYIVPVSVPSSGSRKDIDSCHSPTGKVYTPNPNGSSGNAPGAEALTIPSLKGQNGYEDPSSWEDRRVSSELRAYLQKSLPEYMVPSFFVFLDALPLTPSGKIDRRALPTLTRSHEVASTPVMARTLVEEVLVGIYREILRKETQVGISDSFFELGGHSLLATQVVSRIRALIGVEVPLRELFEAPTVAALAQRVEILLQSVPGTALLPLVPTNRAQPLPLSFAQSRVWFLHQIARDSSTYTLPLVVKIQGRLSHVLLERCLREIAQRHESLRTTFSIPDRQPVQVIHEAFCVEMPVIDLFSLSKRVTDEEIASIIRAEMARPFDLQAGPLWRGGVLRITETEHIFFLVMHHIIFDAWSSSILLQELSALYEAFAQGKPSPLAPLGVQYADFAFWQRERLRGEILEELTSYWVTHLSGAKALEIHGPWPRPTMLSNRGAIHTFWLSAETLRQLHLFCAQERVTLFMVLLSAFQILLSRYTKQQDIVVGTDIANRTRAETERMLGFFVNLLVMRTQIRGQDTFRETVQRVRATVLDAYAHQDLPFEKIVDALHLERISALVPLVNVLFVMQNIPLPPTTAHDLLMTVIDFETQTAKFDVAVFVMEKEEGLAGFVNYRTDLFDAGSITRMFEHFLVLLQNIAALPDSMVSALELSTTEEKEAARQKAMFNRESHRQRLKVSRRSAIPLSSPLVLPSTETSRS